MKYGFTWHLGWAIFDLIVSIAIAILGYPPGRGIYLYGFAIGFFLYRVWYHGSSAWRLR